MVQKPTEQQTHTTKEKWAAIERGVTKAFKSPKFGGFFLMELLHHLADCCGAETPLESKESDCVSKDELLELEKVVAAQGQRIDELCEKLAKKEEDPVPEESEDSKKDPEGDSKPDTPKEPKEDPKTDTPKKPVKKKSSK